jgi:hypothetical protein
MPKMMEGSPAATRSRWRASSCVRGIWFCTSTTRAWRGQRVHGLAHLLARGEQHQGAVFHARQVGEQGLDHLGGELRGVLRVGVRLGGDQVPCAA